MKNQFSEYKISSEIVDALTILGYTEPTEIQKEVIPFALQGRDIVAKSQTGSGKTAAFAIPLCELSDWSENTPAALVLEPSRELTVQVKQEIFNIGRNKRLKVADVFGGFPIDKQIQTLKQKTHIVVGTPGRVMDHVRRGTLDLSKIKYLVIDEADLMLDMGFIDEVSKIIEKIPSKRVIMLFSATLGESLENLIEKYMTNPETITIESETETVDEVDQTIYEVTGDKKYDAFLSILIKENPESCMVFCGTRDMVNVLSRMLKKDGVKSGIIHGEIDQSDRIKTIEGFREGRFRCLIATEVAARGIDFENLTHVFNYDFPTGKEAYVHRIGRTGRNGNSGKAISLITNYDKSMRDMVEEFIHMKIKDAQVPSRKDLKESKAEKAFWDRQNEKPVLRAKKGAGFNKTITRITISGGKKAKMRAVDIVGTVCSLDGVEADDIGIIDVRDSLTYVEILNGKGKTVLDALQEKTIKGKLRNVRITQG